MSCNMIAHIHDHAPGIVYLCISEKITVIPIVKSVTPPPLFHDIPDQKGLVHVVHILIYKFLIKFISDTDLFHTGPFRTFLCLILSCCRAATTRRHIRVMILSEKRKWATPLCYD